MNEKMVKRITLEPLIGSPLEETIKEAIELADWFGCLFERVEQKGAEVAFDFNGATAVVRIDSDPELILRDMRRVLAGYIEGPVGPYPNSTLTDEEQQNDARIQAENDEKHAQLAARAAAEYAEAVASLEQKLALLPTIDLSDEDGWQRTLDANSEEPYGQAVMKFSEAWARLMQAGIADGKTIAEIAGDCNKEADAYGITGFQYGCAVSILSLTWQHGEELRRWHNAQYGISIGG